MSPALTNVMYVAAAVLFIFGLKMLGRPESARRGNALSAIGMLIAVIATLLGQNIIHFTWVVAGGILGALIGTIAAYRVKMTAMPEMVALFNGFGGLASLLVGWAEFHNGQFLPDSGFTALIATTSMLAILIGGITFTGSVIAYGKLSGRVKASPVQFTGQKAVNALLLLTGVICILSVAIQPESPSAYAVMMTAIIAAFILGILAVIPIGGADMPVVISLLNSYSGLAACAAGFAIGNNVLIVAGCLVGASGIILTRIMCKAMNRSLLNVLFSGFGSSSHKSSAGKASQDASPISTEDAYYILEAAGSVLFVPGYGMAVAQAQHAVFELYEQLESTGCDVSFAIHPVAGRMPGHMNVLLAEANIPYEKLVEPDDVNPMMESVDVAVVIGANDVVNPAARDDAESPIHGMPIIEVDRAKTVFVLKRSLAKGFAQVENPLFYLSNTRMVFGDAKASVSELVTQFKDS